MANASPKITVGMAVAGRVEWTMATIQALNFFHPAVREQGEILVIDNAPELVTWVKNDRPCQRGEAHGMQALEAHCRGVPNCRYEVWTEKRGTAAPRQRIFEQARGEIVLVIDAHVFVAPDAISKLLRYFEANPDSGDLIQGPWVHDSCDPRGGESHMNPVWRGGMFGTWGRDPRLDDPSEALFEIPSQGLGLFACRKAAWQGFNPAFKEFGGEEGYIHEKFRRAGHRTLCAPWLRWWHCFKNTNGVQYAISDETKLWNYLVGAAELGLPDDHPMSAANAIRHFCGELKTVPAQRALEMNSDAHRVQLITLMPSQSDAVQAAAAAPAPSGPVSSEAVAREIVQAVQRPGSGHLDELPPVYCLMPTYGRMTLARQAVASFLAQDYPNKKLVILNQGRHPVVGIDHPDIQEIHRSGMLMPDRSLPTLADLHAELLQYAPAGSLVRHWDDDDLVLPWGISQGVAFLREGLQAWKPQAHWYEQGGASIGLVHNTCEGSVTFRREALTPGCYDRMASGGDIAGIYSQLSVAQQLQVHDLGYWSSYVYRFGISPDHTSGRYAGRTREEIQERLKYYRESHTDHGDGSPMSLADGHLPEAFRRVTLASYPWGDEMQRRVLKMPPASIPYGPLSPDEVLLRILEAKFPDRTGLVACEVGRKHTAQLAQSVRIKQAFSIDADTRTLPGAISSCGANRVKMQWRAEISESCDGCNGLPEWFDVMIFADPNPMQVLQAFRQLQRRVGTFCVICVPNYRSSTAAVLLRCLIEPWFGCEEIGDWLVFTPRQTPSWQVWNAKEQPR